MGKNQKIAAAAGVLVFAIGIVCLMFTVRAHKKREIVLEFGKEMADAKVLPVERKIPKNIEEDVEKYLYKKELSEAAEEK